MMRKLDTWLGVPLCIFARLFSFREKELSQSKKIIVSKFLGIGSVVLALPFFKVLKEEGYQILFLGFPSTTEAVVLSELVDKTIVIEPKWNKFLFSLVIAIKGIWKYRASVYIDLEPTANFSAWLAKLSAVNNRMGFNTGKKIRESLFTELVLYNEKKHISNQYFSFLEKLQIKTSETIQLPKINFIPSNVIRNKIIFSMNCSELSYLRLWPEENWVHLVEEFLKNTDCEIWFTGIKNDSKRVNRVIRHFRLTGRVHSLVGKTSLKSLLEFVADANLAIGVDNGTMHLLAWAKVPMVVLFGPETPVLFSPLSENMKVLYLGLPCSPCLTLANSKVSYCKDNQCIKQINYKEVYLQASGFLKDQNENRKMVA